MRYSPFFGIVGNAPEEDFPTDTFVPHSPTLICACFLLMAALLSFGIAPILGLGKDLR